jgi:hypothetical protein
MPLCRGALQPLHRAAVAGVHAIPRKVAKRKIPLRLCIAGLGRPVIPDDGFGMIFSNPASFMKVITEIPGRRYITRRRRAS